MKDSQVLVNRSLNKVLMICGLFLASFTPVFASEQLVDTSIASQTAEESSINDNANNTASVEPFIQKYHFLIDTFLEKKIDYERGLHSPSRVGINEHFETQCNKNPIARFLLIQKMKTIAEQLDEDDLFVNLPLRSAVLDFRGIRKIDQNDKLIKDYFKAIIKIEWFNNDDHEQYRDELVYRVEFMQNAWQISEVKIQSFVPEN